MLPNSPEALGQATPGTVSPAAFSVWPPCPILCLAENVTVGCIAILPEDNSSSLLSLSEVCPMAPYLPRPFYVAFPADP